MSADGDDTQRRRGRGIRNAQPRSGQLSENDRELWGRVARTVSPVTNTKARLLDSAGIDAMEQALRGEADSSATAASRKPPAREHRREASENKPGRPNHGPPPASPRQPADLVRMRQAARELHGIDRNELRKVRSGRVSIDARIDLHGLRQHEAHGELRRFLYRSHANGARWVIVITGKGSRQRAAGRSDGDQGSRGGLEAWGGEERGGGILREKVPQWLHDADLRAIVVGFTQAGPRHGGEGALYVRLRGRGTR